MNFPALGKVTNSLFLDICIIYFECAIDVLPPMARRDTPAAPRNSWVSASLEKSLTECWDCISGCKTTDNLVQVKNNGFKYSAWKFCPLLSFRGGRCNAKRTIEFRIAPWITRADDCLAWVEFVVAFIHASIFPRRSWVVTCFVNTRGRSVACFSTSRAVRFLASIVRVWKGFLRGGMDR